MSIIHIKHKINWFLFYPICTNSIGHIYAHLKQNKAELQVQLVRWHCPKARKYTRGMHMYIYFCV